MPADMDPGFLTDCPRSSRKIRHQYHMVEQFSAFGNARRDAEHGCRAENCSLRVRVIRDDDGLRPRPSARIAIPDVSPAPGQRRFRQASMDAMAIPRSRSLRWLIRWIAGCAASRRIHRARSPETGSPASSSAVSGRMACRRRKAAMQAGIRLGSRRYPKTPNRTVVRLTPRRSRNFSISRTPGSTSALWRNVEVRESCGRVAAPCARAISAAPGLCTTTARDRFEDSPDHWKEKK